MSFEKRALPKLDLNVTNDCNLRCRHCCFRSGEADLGELSFDEIKCLLNEFRELGGWRIDITGGEPLIRGDIDDIIRLAVSDLDIKTELVTNSLLLTEEKLAFYKKIGLPDIAISLDGSTAETHSRIRGISPVSYQKVLKNIQKCAEMGFSTKVNTVVFDSNLHDLVSITRLAIDLGAREHGLYYFSPIGRGTGDASNVADPLAWLKIIREELPRFSDKIKLSLEVPILEAAKAQELDISCYLQSPWHLQILPDGNVFPCAIMAASGRPLANLHEKSLKEIWASEDLWNDGYYKQNVLPEVERNAACVNYPSFSSLIRSKEYEFVCLCKKFKLGELEIK